MAERSAADVYTIEPIEAPKPKRWGSVALAWITALFTFGGGSTPVVGAGVRVLDDDGRVLAEHDDGVESMLGTYEAAAQDLAELTAEEFASRWIPSSAS